MCFNVLKNITKNLPLTIAREHLSGFIWDDDIL